ncbi:MAG: leucine-rich repeat protein [Candidatus Saccharibacteria bacterium]|nr:leucine-rich repeat protein [Candidatus Saccharibacteria bacterium]
MKKMNRTLQKYLAVILSVMVAVCSTPTVTYAQLAETDTVTIAFNTGEDAGYVTTPDGYDYDGEGAPGIYSKSFTETSEGETVTLLDAPDDIPLGKVFVKWESEDGADCEPGDVMALSTLDVDDGDTYTFTAVYADIYSIEYDVNGGNDPATANPTSWNVTDGDILLNNPSYTDDIYTFNGWWLADDTEFEEGQEITSAITTLNSTLFDAISGSSIKLVADWYPTDFTVALYGLNGVSSDSISALENLGFDMDDEDAPTTATASLTVEDAITIPALEKEGYRFVKWDDGNDSTDDGTTIELAAGDIRSGLDFTATFEQEHTLTLSGLANIDDGSVAALEGLGFTVGSSTATKVFTASDTAFDLPNVESDSYEFFGWYTDDPTSASKDVEFDPGVDTDTTYTARFANSYSVTFMDGTTELDTLGFMYQTDETSIRLPALPDKDYYSGEGWVIVGDETETVYTSDADLDLETIGIEDEDDYTNLVFDASYTATPFTITLTGLSGVSENSIAELEDIGFTMDDEDAPTSATVTKTVEDALTIPAIVKDGYRFIKWDDSDSGTVDGRAVDFEVGEITDNFEFAATFEQEYTLTLNGVAGITAGSVADLEEKGFTVSGNTAALVFIDDDEEFVIPNVAKEGYDFFGWYAGDDPTSAALDLTFDPSTAADASYTASLIRSYTVTFMDGMTELTSLGFTYLTGADSINLPALADKDGYTSDGWVLQGDETATEREAGATLSLADIGIEDEEDETDLVFVAKYSTIPYTITLSGLDNADSDSITALEAVGFTLSDNNVEATAVKTVEDAVTIPAMSGTGFRFLGWQKDGTGTDFLDEVVLEEGDILSDLNYTAVLKQEYTLSLTRLGGITDSTVEALEADGFTISNGTATKKFINTDSVVVLPTVAKANYDFLGWYASGQSETTASTNVTFDPSEEQNGRYVARFVRSYTVTFMDGTTELTDLGFTYLTGAESINLPAVPGKTGYTNLGWSLVDGSNIYEPGTTLELSNIGISSAEDEQNLVFVAEYETIPYTITLTGLTGVSENSIDALEDIGFTVEDGTATITKTIEDSLTIPEISKDGFRFMKWDDSDAETTDGKTVELAVGDIDDDLSYAAVFEQEYTLILAGLEGITSASVAALEDKFTVNDDGTATLIFVDDDEAFNLPAVAKTDYDFLGWYTGDDPTTATLTVNFNPSTAADATYTARFVRSYTVTFMDGTTELADLGFTYLTGATSITIPAIPDKLGYTSGEGWYLQGDETATLYTAGTLTLATIGIEDADDETNLIFVADEYTINNNTVTLLGLDDISTASVTALESAGFTLSENKATVTKTVEDSLTIPAISKLHKVFDGWQKGTDEPTATVTLAVGEITGNLSYTATFSSAKTITVSFDLDGGAFQAADIEGWDDFGYVVGTNEALAAYVDDNLATINNIPAPIKADNVFTGWTVNGGTDKVMSYTLPAPNNQAVALVATWIAGEEGETIIQTEGNAAGKIDNSSVNDIKDILDDNVGTGETSVTKLFIEEDLTDTHAGTAIEDKLEEAFGGTTANITKTYVDIDITQYITSVSNNSIASEIHDLGRVVDIIYTPTNGVANLKAVVREHDGNPKTYTRFKELATAPTGELVDGTYFIDDPVVHIYTRFFSTYALGYATGVYMVSFDANGGNETYDPVYTDQLGTLPTPTRSGYWSFLKWTYPDGSAAATGDTITQDTTLTAQWKDTTPPGPGPGPGPSSYTVTFDSNGGKPVSSITVTDGKLPALPETTKENNTFDGWFYANGTKAAVGDTITSDVTLTARWTQSGTFTVYFDTQGGTAVDPITVTDGKLPTLPTTTKEGNAFNGWLYENGSKAVAGDVITGNVTLTASWTPGVTNYTITFDANGGSAVAPMTVSDNKLPKLPDSTREKYTLDGWFYADGTKAAAGDVIKADTTLTARWTKVKEPAPTEVVPTKNGVVVAKNNDGKNTVTLLDGTNYGKKASINTIKGTDKKTYKITRIYDEAFKGNTTITNVSIGSNVLFIGDSAFDGCTNLKSVSFGSKVKEIGDRAFAGTAITKANVSGKVETIGSYAFAGCTYLKSASIAGKVNSIGESAFDGCTALATVKIGNTVKTVSARAFDGCTGLKTLNIGSGVEVIGVGAFSGCSNLATLTIGMSNIPDGLFSGYANLKKVTIGKTVKSIGESAFASTGITRISLSGKLESIGDYAFYNCQSLTSSSMSKYVKSVGACAFQNCSSMKTASLGSNVETVGDYAYAGCASLKSFKVGKTVKTMGIEVLDGCTNLATLTIDMANIPDNLLKGSTSLKKVSIGSNARTVGDSAFNGCTNLKTLTLGGKLVGIGDYAFAGTAITKATTSKTVTTIGNYAFANCANLKSATIGAGVTYIGAGAYSGDANLATLTVNSSNLTTTEAVGNDFISGIKANATVKIPKKVFDQTKSVFEAKGGAGSQIKYKK